jgi:hypothetical protein
MNRYEFALKAANGLYDLGRAITQMAAHETDPATVAAMVDFSRALARLRITECQKLIDASQAAECIRAEMHDAADAVVITLQ